MLKNSILTNLPVFSLKRDCCFCWNTEILWKGREGQMWEIPSCSSSPDYTLLEGSLPKSNLVEFAIMPGIPGIRLPNALFRGPRQVAGEVLFCFPSGKGSRGRIKRPNLWQHSQLPYSHLMPYSPNQQMFKLFLCFKLLSHYTEEIRQSLLLAVMMSAPASPCSDVVCLRLGKWAGGEGNGEFYLGQAEGGLILLLLRVSDNIPMVFTLVLLCCRHFASGEGRQCFVLLASWQSISASMAAHWRHLF